MKRLLTFLATLALVAAPWIAIGQGFITSHSIPIGQGAGVQGWGIGGPCAPGQGLTWTTSTADPVCGTTVSTSPTTGQGAVVLQSSAYIVTPVIASPTIVSAFTAPGLVTNADLANSTITINGAAIALGGSVTAPTTPNTGQGNVVLQSSGYIVTPTIASATIVSAFTAPGLVTNADLTNAATTVNSQTCTLGSSCTVPTNIASATTGSGNVVLQTSPYVVGATIASPTIVSAFSAVGLVTNADLANSSITVNGAAIALGGSVTTPTTPNTGGGNNVLQSSPYIFGATIASPTIVSAFSAVGLVTNADLVNAATTPNGVTCTLGSTCTLTASASSITAGTTSVYSGATSGILFSDNGKTLSQYTLQGIGPKAQMSSGATVSGNCVKYDVNGNTVDNGAVCGGGGGSSVGPTQTKFTSGSSTYTVPVNVAWIEVTMVGAGGGGGGVGATTGPTGTNGTSSTFGTSLLVAGPGLGGAGDTGASAAEKLGGAGGTASLGSGPLGIATTGNAGGPGINGAALVTTTDDLAGFGAGSCLGGSVGGSSNTNSNGTSASANSGAGGSGAGSTAQGAGAAGGGSGGCIYAFIVTPAATYSTVVGAGGNGGIGTGTNAQTGGAGGSGLISVIEHYNH